MTALIIRAVHQKRPTIRVLGAYSLSRSCRLDVQRPPGAGRCAPGLINPRQPGLSCAFPVQAGPDAIDIRKAGIIEIELGGCRVRVDRDVDTEALQRVLELLRRR
jgi:hypothetical protein